MGDRRRVHCVVCGKHRDEVGELSWSGLCSVDGELIMRMNALGIRDKTGPYHYKRMRGYARWLERQALDDQAASA